jgi:hypothetical protein
MYSPTITQIRHTPAPQSLPLYFDEDSTALVLEIEALIARFAGEPQEGFYEALEGQVLFGMVS